MAPSTPRSIARGPRTWQRTASPPPKPRSFFAQWAKEDTYQPLARELVLLADAGFTHPDAFWKRGPMTVYGGFRR